MFVDSNSFLRFGVLARINKSILIKIVPKQEQLRRIKFQRFAIPGKGRNCSEFHHKLTKLELFPSADLQLYQFISAKNVHRRKECDSEINFLVHCCKICAACIISHSRKKANADRQTSHRRFSIVTGAFFASAKCIITRRVLVT